MELTDDTGKLLIYIFSGITFLISCSVVTYAYCKCHNNTKPIRPVRPRPSIKDIFDNDAIIDEINKDINSYRTALPEPGDFSPIEEIKVMMSFLENVEECESEV